MRESPQAGGAPALSAGTCLDRVSWISKSLDVQVFLLFLLLSSLAFSSFSGKPVGWVSEWIDR